MDGSHTLAQRIGLFLGPGAAAVMLLLGAPEGLTFAGWATGALLVWMAVWWATEPIPIPVTSLLPLIILPLADAGSPRQIGAGYADHIVLLLLGGFIVALSIERWNLHKRIALNVVARIGTSPRMLIAGFMLATALLSMWISNTATTLMMVPIALSAAAALKDESDRFVTALLLGVCYAASIGGVGTPIGTPTNLIAIDWLQTNAGANIGFLEWMSFGLPAVGLLVPAAWWTVTRRLETLENGAAALQEVQSQKHALGRMTLPERRVAMVFALIAVLWISRRWTVQGLEALGWETLSQYSGAQVDMMIAMLGAVLVFLVPASCAFMLPVATAPNAIIYATDQVPIGQMIQRGLRVNLIGIAVITAIGFGLAPLVL